MKLALKKPQLVLYSQNSRDNFTDQIVEVDCSLFTITTGSGVVLCSAFNPFHATSLILLI